MTQMLRLITVLIIAIALHLGPAPTPTRAGGIFVCRDGDPAIRMLEHKAFLVFDDRYQDLVLSVTFEGATGGFGWLVPLPPGTRIEPVDGPLFETLERALERPWVASESYGVIARSPPKIVTPYLEASIDHADLLEAASHDALAGWLGVHGFVLPDDARAILDDHVARGWSLAAIRIGPGPTATPAASAVFSGTTQPISFRFTSERFLFPLGINALEVHELNSLWYILADRPLYPASPPSVFQGAALKPWRKVFLYTPRYRADADRSAVARQRYDILPEHLGGLFRHGDHQTDHLWLTFSRAVLQPQHMVDLAFFTRDPAEVLQSADLRQRVEMIGYLATARPDDTPPLLLDFLADSTAPGETECEPYPDRHHQEPGPGQDLRTAIWALGELGTPDPHVLDRLKSWLTAKPTLYTLEALKALHRLDAPSAATAALDIAMLDHGDLEPDRCMLDLYRAARDVIISDGHADLLPRLREHRSRFGAIDELDDQHADVSIDERTRGADAIVMAAACGDTDAQSEVFRWLRDDVASWLCALSDGDTITSSESTDHYPNELHPLTRLVTGSSGGRLGLPRHHPMTSALLPPLAGRREVLDTVLRRVADVDTLSALGRAFVLASLPEPEPEDHARLRHLWMLARQAPRRVTVLSRQLEPPGLCPQKAEFDLDACSVVYAMAQLGLSDDVWSCWQRVTWSEPALKGEILVALSRSYRFGQAPNSLLDAAIDYLRRVWNHRLAVYLAASCFDPMGKPGAGQWPYETAHDAAHRTAAVADILRKFPPEYTWRLLADVTLEPDVRLYWLSRSWGRLRRDDPDRLRLLLRAIKKRLRDPNLTHLCEQFEARLAG